LYLKNTTKKELEMKLIVVIVSIIFTFNAYSLEKVEIIRMIEYQAKKNNVDSNLALAIVDTESKFNPHAKKFESNFNTYSVGLFQILIPTSRALGFTGFWKDLFSPKLNIELGIKYIKICTDRFQEDIELIACCHNAGFAVKESVCKNNPNVRNYIEKVLSYYNELKFNKIALN
jgi:soluble lytic murein transglycosylase-like protein